MKLIILLLFPVLCFSQFQKEKYFFISTEVDPRNAIFGSEVNPPAYDGVFNIGYRDNGINFQLAYETFAAIKFQSLELKGGYILNNTENFQYGALFGLGFIFRDVDWTKAMSCSVSLSGQVEYHFDKIFVFARGEGRYRGDIQKIIPSGYIGLGLKL